MLILKPRLRPPRAARRLAPLGPPTPTRTTHQANLISYQRNASPAGYVAAGQPAAAADGLPACLQQSTRAPPLLAVCLPLASDVRLTPVMGLSACGRAGRRNGSAGLNRGCLMPAFGARQPVARWTIWGGHPSGALGKIGLPQRQRARAFFTCIAGRIDGDGGPCSSGGLRPVE